MKVRYRRQPCLQQGFCTGAAKPSCSKSTHRHLPPAQLEKKITPQTSWQLHKEESLPYKTGFCLPCSVAPEVMLHLWVVISHISLRNCCSPELTESMSPWSSLQQSCLLLTVPPWWWPSLSPKWNSRCHGDILTWIHNKTPASHQLFVQAVNVLLCRWKHWSWLLQCHFTSRVVMAWMP